MSSIDFNSETEKYFWYKSIASYKVRHVYEVITQKDFYNKKHYAGKDKKDAYSVNELIAENVSNGAQFFVGRYGANELSMVIDSMDKRFRKQLLEAGMHHNACNGSGFYPCTEEALNEFADIMIEATGQIDLLAAWNLRMEEYMLKRLAPNANVTNLKYIEPWQIYHDASNIIPWTNYLKGKKVLVVHPFVNSIKFQYENNREKIFSNLGVVEGEFLPKFELICYKSIQSINCVHEDRFPTWVDALKHMIKECSQLDFDIALVGCGAYGFPLSAELKKIGKCVIHMGGSLQLLFGIKGVRWDSHPVISKMYNEYWIRPDEIEKAQGFENVEDGCYW